MFKVDPKLLLNLHRFKQQEFSEFKLTNSLDCHISFILSEEKQGPVERKLHV